ncbi:MAG: hypothetical protein IJK52_08510 [Oscillospiraceae bacterium]|nr:hypothetical protein [Oscillospiraceae bacterium]
MFNTNVITLQGMNAARALLAGNRTMVITRAVGGSEVSSASGLPAMTALPRVNQTLSIVCLLQGNNGPELLIRIASAGLETAYALHQIGVYARLDDEEEFLFQILQDEAGVNVPAQSEAVGITLDLRIGLAVEVGDATVTLDSAAYVTYGQLQGIMGDVPRTRDSVAFSVDPNQWESSLTGAGAPIFPGLYWQAVIRDSKFSDKHLPLLLFHPTSLPATARYGVSAFCDMEYGELYLFAQEKPETPLIGECHMFITQRSDLSGLPVEPGASGRRTWGSLFGL